MFRNKMTRQRVQTASPEAGHDEIGQYALSARYEVRN